MMPMPGRKRKSLFRRFHQSFHIGIRSVPVMTFPACSLLKTISRDPRYTHKADKALLWCDIWVITSGMTCCAVLIPNLACWITCEKFSRLRQLEIVYKVKCTMIRLAKGSFFFFINNMNIYEDDFYVGYFSLDNTGLSRLNAVAVCQILLSIPWVSYTCSSSPGRLSLPQSPFTCMCIPQGSVFVSDLSPNA